MHSNETTAAPLFHEFDFDVMNEAAVREEILAPLIRFLGYRSGTVNNVIRELHLVYPRIAFGRQAPNGDPILRARADYLLEVEGSIRWVIEAKPPSDEITFIETGQAYSYATHPEVRAGYYCLCNGRELRVYQSNRSPESPPISSVPYEDFNGKLTTVLNVLSPDAIKRDFREVRIDTGVPIGPGLRSFAQVIGGRITYLKNTANIALLNGFNVSIIHGSIERNDEGQLVANLETLSPFVGLQELAEKLGLKHFEVVSDDPSLSTDPGNPTSFTSHTCVLWPAGTNIPNLATGRIERLRVNMEIKTAATGRGYLKNNTFAGSFTVRLAISQMGAQVLAIEIVGTCEINLA